MSKIILSHNFIANIHPYIYAYLGQNPDINSLHDWRDAGIYGIYNCSQAPSASIGILEVLPYSKDWCVQRFTTISATDGTSATYQRCWWQGNRWSGWKRIYYTT